MDIKEVRCHFVTIRRTNKKIHAPRFGYYYLAISQFLLVLVNSSSLEIEQNVCIASFHYELIIILQVHYLIRFYKSSVPT